MTDSVEEIQRLGNLALSHTGPILTSSLDVDLTSSYGVASCVYLRVNRDSLAVSCRHVEANADRYFVNAPAFLATRDGLLTMPDNAPTWPVAVWTVGDLVIFLADEERIRQNGRQFLDLGTAHRLQLDDLRTGNTAIICGIWSKESCFAEAYDRRFLDPISYTAKGTVTHVTDHEITARFEEREVLVFDENHQHCAAQIEPKGESRDLKGMSGSGLWIPQTDGGVSFAGILRRPRTKAGDPDIVFTPAWDVIRFVELYFPRDSSPEEDKPCP